LTIVKTTLIRIKSFFFVYEIIVVCFLKIARLAKIKMIIRVAKTTMIAKTSIIAKKYLNQERKNNF
jgi:hypothetical protein